MTNRRPARRRLRKRILGIEIHLAFISALLFGCSRLPSYAAPQGGTASPAEVDGSDVISYRQLSRADFKAGRLPEDASPYAKKIGALTCAHVLTTPDTHMVVQTRKEPNGDTSVVGRFGKLGFHARMDRSCSWWNPERSELPDEYVLQHEQIHFALAELEARYLNRLAPEIVAEFRVEGSDQDEVKAELQETLEELLDEALDRLLERNRDFDEDTSAVYAPEVQQKWHDEVQQELAESPARP